ncbi:hypothetical protein FPV67DRAFT_1765876 [Lyophyllum atratum]|nr:hypothetical protein FPV67DRAFT_1765876 [Lyophyllum atratum]
MASLSTQEQPVTVNGKLDIHTRVASQYSSQRRPRPSKRSNGGNIVKEYNVTAGKLDNHEAWGAGRVLEDHLGIQVAIGVFAEVEGEVGIALIYAVYVASWNVGYNIRVDMKTKEEQVTLIYKAALHRALARILTDARTPTFSVSVPTLDP